MSLLSNEKIELSPAKIIENEHFKIEHSFRNTRPNALLQSLLDNHGSRVLFSLRLEFAIGISASLREVLEPLGVLVPERSLRSYKSNVVKHFYPSDIVCNYYPKPYAEVIKDQTKYYAIELGNPHIRMKPVGITDNVDYKNSGPTGFHGYHYYRLFV